MSPSLRKHRATAGAVAALAVLGGSLAACGARVVSSSSQHVYFQLPSGWKVYSERSLQQGPTPQVSLGSNPPDFLVAASANPKPHPTDVFTPARFPWAISLVRKLTSAEQQQMSLAGLADVLVNVDALASQGFSVQVVTPPRLLVKGNMRGTVASFNFGGTMDYTQATWVNNETDKVWLLMVGCSTTCFQANQSIISHVVQSFYVQDRGNS